MSYFHVNIFDFHLLRDLYSHSHSHTFFILFSLIHHLLIICSPFIHPSSFILHCLSITQPAELSPARPCPPRACVRRTARNAHAAHSTHTAHGGADRDGESRAVRNTKSNGGDQSRTKSSTERSVCAEPARARPVHSRGSASVVNASTDVSHWRTEDI